MKVLYLKPFTDQFNFTFLDGWTAEHDDAEGQRRIDAGYCERVSDNVRPTRHASVGLPLLDQCIMPASSEMELSGNPNLPKLKNPPPLPPPKANIKAFGAV